MPVRVKMLRCRVRVRAGAKQEGLARREMGEARPSLLFAVPNAPATLETGPIPGKTASGESEEAHAAHRATPAASARRASPRQVADRVYDLMREDAWLARLRGG